MTEEVKLDFTKKAIEWAVFSCPTFSVQVRGWTKYGGEFAWNVYAFIFDGHPLHHDLDGAMDLPFHGGVTLDNRVVTTPAAGLKYDWQKVHDVLKLGSDYSHAYDDHFATYDPADGIPHEVQRDAIDLVSALNAAGAK